jgi:flagellar motility protein MotE (MotC chaperone)
LPFGEWENAVLECVLVAAEADKNKENQKPDEAAKAEAKVAAKSGVVKYVLFGVGGLVAVVAVAFGTLMLVGGGSSSEPTAEIAGQPDSATHSTSQSHDSVAETLSAGLDSVPSLEEQGSAALDEMLAAIQALDFAPAADAPVIESVDVARTDSAAVNWVEKEKSRLTEWEKELNARDKQLNVRESQVKQKMLVLEQAESSRIAKLAKLYDGMDANSVAKLIANLDDETVVALLPRMNSKNASAVMALMPPVRAARLSKQMITIAEN